ncbi:exosome complex exonuclease RRP6-like protein [Achlya hypogyna]|uniref:Exosome complex exonuclease RRP6-like protein n=1 Tax=Achlya hypogyna TaxID=1202772 RepID=A0A1V9YER7_ACHHY|nr:exosome complex exonuclease RRP6-like protein [Achlya hypogyna]
MSEHGDAPGLMVTGKRTRVKPKIFQIEEPEPKKRSTKPKAKKPAPKRPAPTGSNADDETLPAKKVATTGAAKTKNAAKPKKAPQPEKKPVDAAEIKKLIGKPFYVEDGAEWHGTNINFDDLGTLREMWQLPAACHILWLLQRPLNLKVYNTLREYEAALLNPETSAVLEDVFTKLLLAKKERDRLAQGLGLSYDWWNGRLKEHYATRYRKWASLKKRAGASLTSDNDNDDDNDIDNDDESASKKNQKDLSDDEWALLDRLNSSLSILGVLNPLQSCNFGDLEPRVRCLVLLDLCETILIQPGNLEYIREMEDDDLRVQPIGSDRVGNRYYYYPQFYHERRVYRLAAAEAGWELWAKGRDPIQAFYDALVQATKRGRKVAGEMELLDHLEALLEAMQAEAAQAQREEEKALRRAILEAMPRKRSARIQVLTQEKIEEEKLEREARVAREAEEAEQQRQELRETMAKEKAAERKRILAERDPQAVPARETRSLKKLLEEEASERDRRAHNRR